MGSVCVEPEPVWRSEEGFLEEMMRAEVWKMCGAV